jgi:hypothetical protein
MNTHPGQVSFQFTKKEVNEADFRRFNLLFGRLSFPFPEDTKYTLRDMCGCLSITFDDALQTESASPLKHPAFHRFARSFFDNCLGLPFLINLEDATFWLLFLGSLEALTNVEVDGTREGRWHFDKNEFCDRGELCKARATDWCEKAGFTREQAAERRAKIEAYLLDLKTAHEFRW